MTDAIEVAIEKALLDWFVQFDPTIPKALPNTPMTPPLVGPNVKWLRASFMPNAPIDISVGFGSQAQLEGIFQVDTFQGQTSGELPIGRVAAAVVDWFKRGTTLFSDGYTIQVVKRPNRGPMLKNNPWVFIPVSISYVAFAA